MHWPKTVIASILMVTLIVSAAVSAAADDLAMLSAPTSDELLQQNAGSGLRRFPERFELSFQRNLREKHVFLAFFYSDPINSIYNLPEDAWWLQDELRSQGRQLARQTLLRALRDTVDDVEAIHRVKVYGQSLSRADVRVQNGKVAFSGLSLPRAGEPQPADDEDLNPGLRETFRSSLSLMNGVDLGLNWRTTAGPYQLLVTYFLTGNDHIGVSLDRDLTNTTGLTLTHRVAPNEATSLALVSLHF
jgi:hypothetical protein